MSCSLPCAQRPTERQLLADHRDLRVSRVSPSYSIGLQEATSGDDARSRSAFVVLFDQCHVDVTPDVTTPWLWPSSGDTTRQLLAGANTVSLPSSHCSRSPAEVLRVEHPAIAGRDTQDVGCDFNSIASMHVHRGYPFALA